MNNTSPGRSDADPGPDHEERNCQNMRLLIQRVQEASVEIENHTVGQIGRGYLVLIGCCESDTKEIADQYLRKMLSLRIFGDENGKTNLSLKDVNGSLLLVSQFTLYANCRRGNRPSFSDAGSPEHAKEIYDYIISECSKIVPIVQTGEFGAEMKVHLTNDGPFTILLDEHLLSPRR